MITEYISKKRLMKYLNQHENGEQNAPTFGFVELISAYNVLSEYPDCKYYIYDYEAGTFKPSKRK